MRTSQWALQIENSTMSTADWEQYNEHCTDDIIKKPAAGIKYLISDAIKGFLELEFVVLATRDISGLDGGNLDKISVNKQGTHLTHFSWGGI